MSYPIEDIEGIGPSNAEKLATIDIKTTSDLIEKCGSPAGRKECAEATGYEERRLLDWANAADLMRINGVGGQYAELLERSGVDTVKELATRNAANLAEKMEEINNEKNLANRVPSETECQTWIDEAGTMEAVITH